MSDKVSKKDKKARKKHGLKVQPDPKANTFPSAHDLVLEQVDNYNGSYRFTKSSYLDYVYQQTMKSINLIARLLEVDAKSEIKKRKQFGLDKYGTALQPFNGRDNLEDALDELIDAAVYLRAQQYESRVNEA